VGDLSAHSVKFDGMTCSCAKRGQILLRKLDPPASSRQQTLQSTFSCRANLPLRNPSSKFVHPAHAQTRLMEASTELEAAEEKQSATEEAAAAARTEAEERGAQLERVMQAQGRLTDQLADQEAENEVWR